jgi:hypothetical protein
MHKQPKLESFLEEIEKEIIGEDNTISNAAQEVLGVLDGMNTKDIIEVLKFVLRGTGDTLGLKAASALNEVSKTIGKKI